MIRVRAGNLGPIPLASRVSTCIDGGRDGTPPSRRQANDTSLRAILALCVMDQQQRQVNLQRVMKMHTSAPPYPITLSSRNDKDQNSSMKLSWACKYGLCKPEQRASGPSRKSGSGRPRNPCKVLVGRPAVKRKKNIARAGKITESLIRSADLLSTAEKRETGFIQLISRALKKKREMRSLTSFLKGVRAVAISLRFVWSSAKKKNKE